MFPLENKTLALELIYYVALTNSNIKRSELAMPKYGKPFLALIDAGAVEALHIPSHYYLQHGMWEAVADSNMRAFDSSMAWVEANDFSLQDLNAHNYGHLAARR